MINEIIEYLQERIQEIKEQEISMNANIQAGNYNNLSPEDLHKEVLQMYKDKGDKLEEWMIYLNSEIATGDYSEVILEQTCGACPEQYDAFYNGENIGYLRLRHGIFRVDYKDERGVYIANPKGDGVFDPEERGVYLKRARKVLYDKIQSQKA